MTDATVKDLPVPEESAPVPVVVAQPVPVPAAPLGVVADVLVQVVCPSCQRAAEVNASRRNAEDFCRTCDYPLFWAVRNAADSPRPGGADTGLRRLPGTAGFASLAFVPCPSCTEPNAPRAVRCVRCNAEMHPAAVVAPAPVVEPPAPEEVVVAPPGHNWWLLATAAAAVLGLIVLGLLLLND
jgi:hypothetical protein